MVAGAGLDRHEAEELLNSDDGLHRRLTDLLRRYNVNDYAASVQVFAVKP